MIADAPNYIKGFRYQLFCEAKAAGTRSVVVNTAATEDECRTWNSQRLEAWGWPVERRSVEAKDGGSTATVSGPKIGGDVVGDLQPESHTAIYGDKPLYADTRSETSSTGAAVSDDEDGAVKMKRAADTMTLKSLYISDQRKDAPEHTVESDEPSGGPSIQSNTVSDFTAVPSTPPSPRASLPYSPHTLTSLFMRYEPPSPFTRWDTPLFTVPSTDHHPPYQSIWDAIFPKQEKSTSKKALSRIHAQEQARQAQLRRTQEQQNTKDEQEEKEVGRTDSAVAENTGSTSISSLQPVRMNTSTVLPSSTAPNALQTLESTTGELVKALLTASRAATSNFTSTSSSHLVAFTLPTDQTEVELLLPANATLTQPLLQRLRRKYTLIQRGGVSAPGRGKHIVQGRAAIIEDFVRFLEVEFEGISG